MDYKLITEKEYQQIMQEFREIKSSLNEERKPEKKVYSNDDFCNLLGISKRTSQTYRDAGLIEFSKVGSKIFYTWHQIQSFLEKNHSRIQK